MKSASIPALNIGGGPGGRMQMPLIAKTNYEAGGTVAQISIAHDSHRFGRRMFQQRAVTQRT